MEGWPVPDLDLVQVPGVGDRLDRLLQPDLVDAVVLHAPEPTLARRRGWRLAIDLGRYDAPMQNSCAVVTRRAISTRRALCLTFLEAYLDGVWRFRTDAAFGRRVLTQISPDLDPEAVAESWQFLAGMMSGTIYPSRAGLRRAGELLILSGAAISGHADALDESLVAELEADGAFARVMGTAG